MDGCVDCNVVGIIDCKKESDGFIRRVDMETYLTNPGGYTLREGSTEGAPKCPYGNHYKWIGYDLEANEYVRFTKSVFKKLIQNH